MKTFLKKLRSKFYFLLICISDIPIIIRLMFYVWRRNRTLKGKTLDQHRNAMFLDMNLGDYKVGDNSKVNDYVHYMDRKYLNLPGDYRVTDNSGINLYVEQISKDALITDEERSRKFRNLEITKQVLKTKIDNGGRPL